jgi:hypothetical protein
MSQKLTIAHIAAERQFKHTTLYKSKANGGFEWDLPNLHFFYTERGYFIYRTSIDRFVPIRVIDNIVKIAGKKELVDEILNFLLNIDECPPHIHQFALKEISKATSDDFLITLPEKQVEFRKDRKDAIQLYFQNCIVKITADKVTEHPYTDLNGFIWESQILPREYKAQQINPSANFSTFISNIANNDQSRVNALCAAFGFYLHNYKDADYCPAVILNDEIISDNPEGGTGKSLFFEAISYFIKTEIFDGELFSFEKGFLYQRIKPDTRLVFFDDTKKGFKFEKLKSFLTGGVTTEKKGKDEIYIPFIDSPKVGIATNYAINNSGNSLERRSLELEISQYYNKKRKPKHEFGHMMFTGWDQAGKEWIQFDNYAIRCCQLFLSHGLIEQVLINLPEKKLHSQTNSQFLEFMEDFKFEYEISKKGMLDQFLAYCPKYKNADWLTVNFFTKWVTIYCDFHKISLDTTGRDKSGSIRVYKFDNFPITVPVF